VVTVDATAGTRVVAAIGGQHANLNRGSQGAANLGAGRHGPVRQPHCAGIRGCHDHLLSVTDQQESCYSGFEPGSPTDRLTPNEKGSVV
jgi:hypothetical protein